MMFGFPNKLEISFEKLTSTGADLVYSDLQVVDNSLAILNNSFWKRAHIQPYKGKSVVPLLIKNTVTGCTILGRKSLLNQALPFPPNIPMHDYWLAFIATFCNGIEYVNTPLVLYRQHGVNILGAHSLTLDYYHKEISKTGYRNLLRHYGKRISDRLALLDGARERNGNLDLEYFHDFYTSPWSKRMLGLTNYVKTVRRNAVNLSLRRLGIETGMVSLPYKLKKL